MEPDIGIPKKDREAVADALAQALADTYATYLKTHGYHWNVEGPRFGALHALFMTQYQELWAALDEIAERIRSLGSYAPAGPDIYSRTTIKADNGVPSENVMLENLVVAHEAVVKSARAALRRAEDAGDDASVDLMTVRCAASEKHAWMLRAHLKN